MEKIDQILESLYDRVIEPVEAKEVIITKDGKNYKLKLEEMQ